MAEQLSFDLPVRVARGRHDFFVSEANATAVAMIEGWRDWPARKLVLTGPVGAGKTHLVHVWAAVSGAAIVPGKALASTDIPTLATGSVAVEDCDRLAGDEALENALFHLHNLVLAEGHSLLLTARRAPTHWPLALPDLASRMQGTPAVTIDEPDDALLSAVMLKLFDDRQLSPQPDLIPYLVNRIDRSFAAAEQIVDRLDRAALRLRRKLNAALAREVLDNAKN